MFIGSIFCRGGAGDKQFASEFVVPIYKKGLGLDRVASEKGKDKKYSADDCDTRLCNF